MTRIRVAAPQVPLTLAAKIRVIYGDTDRMGVVYHGTYLRYLEHARVEFMRDLGEVYAAMERAGFGLPVVDIGVSYLAPARYDDVISVYVGIHKLGISQLVFDYTLKVEPGDRFVGEGESPLEAPVTLVHARTRHGCVGFADNQVVRLPEGLHTRLQAHIDAQATKP